jgi:hypothetical protein
MQSSQPSRRDHNVHIVPCTYQGCSRWFRNQSGLTQHLNTSLAHASIPQHSPAPARVHPLAETDSLFPDDGYEVEPQHPSVLPEESDSYAIPDESQPEHLPSPGPPSSSVPQEPRARKRDYHEGLNGKWGLIGTAGGDVSYSYSQAVPVMKTEVLSIRTHPHPLEQGDHLTIGHHTVADQNLS